MYLSTKIHINNNYNKTIVKNKNKEYSRNKKKIYIYIYMLIIYISVTINNFIDLASLTVLVSNFIIYKKYIWQFGTSYLTHYFSEAYFSCLKNVEMFLLENKAKTDSENWYVYIYIN